MRKKEIIGLRTWAQTDAWKTPTENHLIQLELESITYQHYREDEEKSQFSLAWWFCLLTRAILQQSIFLQTGCNSCTSTIWIEGSWGEREITEQNLCLDSIWIWRSSEAPLSGDAISFSVAAQEKNGATRSPWIVLPRGKRRVVIITGRWGEIRKILSPAFVCCNCCYSFPMLFDFYKQVLCGVCFEKKFSGMLQKRKIHRELFFKGVNSVWKLCFIYSLKEKHKYLISPQIACNLMHQYQVKNE